MLILNLLIKGKENVFLLKNIFYLYVGKVIGKGFDYES